MLARIITENGVKKIQPLTADVGAGAPVGSLAMMYKKSAPSGYLYCDGSTFNAATYPALYAYLGSNTLPDYREFAPVGAEQNTTDVYDASTNPDGTIHEHDVYTQGKAKDDQLQNHQHLSTLGSYKTNYNAGTYSSVNIPGTQQSGYVMNVTNARNGTVTRGKRKAVYFYIKATSGLAENQQENVLATINENNSYSTTEQPTGAKWIDGKPIYRKVVDFGALPNNDSKYVAHNIANIDNITDISIIAKNTSEFLIIATGKNSVTDFNAWITTTNINIHTDSDRTAFRAYVTLEYTKTTD